MSAEINAVDPVKSWTPEQNATIDGLQQKLGWSRVQAIHKLRQGEKAGKTPAQILTEATAPKPKPAAKAKPATKAKRETKAKKSTEPKEPAFSTKPAGKGDAYTVEGRGGKYDKQLVVNLYMDGGKSPSEIAALGSAGIKGISPVYCHRILFGNEESGGINKGQTPKTANSYRAIDVQPYVTEMLKHHLAGRTGLVFLSRHKTPLRNCVVLNKHLHPLLRRLSIARGGMHAFRHFRVSFLIQNETPLEVIKRWIGHGSEEMIRRYTHLHPTYRKEVIAKLPVVCPVCPAAGPQIIM